LNVLAQHGAVINIFYHAIVEPIGFFLAQSLVCLRNFFIFVFSADKDTQININPKL
jgi:hypothetical protein